MKQTKKSRLLAILLSAAMLLSMLPTVAFAEETESIPAEQCTVTEGCTLEDGHEGECAIAEPETEPIAEMVTEPIAEPAEATEAENTTGTEENKSEPSETTEETATEEAVEEQVETLSESGVITSDELIRAINNVENDGTVTLAGDIAGNVEVSSNKQFTLDLNG